MGRGNPMSGVWEEGSRCLEHGKREADVWSVGRGKAMAELWEEGSRWLEYRKREGDG